MRRVVVAVAAVALFGCASLTSSECKRYVAIATLAVNECNRIEDPDNAATCMITARAALMVAEQECGRFGDDPGLPSGESPDA